MNPWISHESKACILRASKLDISNDKKLISANLHRIPTIYFIAYQGHATDSRACIKKEPSFMISSID